MNGIEVAYCNNCLSALIGAWQGLMEASAGEAIRKVKYGKGDTLGLDAIAEVIIKGRLFDFDPHAILITEELDGQSRHRWTTEADPIKQPLMFFSDPTDRSAQLMKFFTTFAQKDPAAKIGACMAQINPEELWGEMFEKPAVITGSSTSITCVRKGKIVFSLIVNFITATVVCAVREGVFLYKLQSFDNPKNNQVTIWEVMKKGSPLIFPGVTELGYRPDECKRFVTFLGKTGYKENFNDSMLFVENPEQYLHHKEPPGPPRPLYLSNLQKGHGPVGFILSNGEKIGEWMGWLSFVKYAKNSTGNRALRVFEISLERPWTKNGMLMSTPPHYSLFYVMSPERGFLDLSRLRNFERPSQFRCMIVVLPADNERMIHVLEQYQYREVTHCF